MSTDHKIHEAHSHAHGPNCGHTAVEHEGHVDYLHDGHLHHMDRDHVCEHQISVGTNNPAQCTPQHDSENTKRVISTAPIAVMKQFRTVTMSITW